MRSLRRRFLSLLAILLAVGVVMVYSTSAIYCGQEHGDPAYFLKRHLVYLAVGIAGFLWVLSLDPDRIRCWVKPLLVLTLVSLAAVLLPGLGRRVSGASRWFRVGSFSFQPSEMAQVAVILYLADVLTRKGHAITQFFRGVVPPLLVLGLTLGLILAEPDLGTAVALAMVALILFFIAGVKPKVLLALFLTALPAVAGLILMKPYRVRRILSYLNPWADPEGSGFQLIQSLVALGSGGWIGLGLGESRQKLFYLPAAHTDFIFAVMGEELGFLGVSLILAALGFLIFYGVRIAMAATDSFGTFAGIGFMTLIALESLVHVAVNLGIIPTKGLPLPFISYGGTALVANLVSMALLLNLCRPREAGG